VPRDCAQLLQYVDEFGEVAVANGVAFFLMILRNGEKVIQLIEIDKKKGGEKRGKESIL
jgi:hypothetical protein